MGKEVEELTRKEIIKALRTRIPMEQYLHNSKGRDQPRGNNQKQRYQDNRRNDNPRNSEQQNRPTRPEPRQQQPQQQRQQDDNAIISPSRIVSNLERHGRQPLRCRDAGRRA